ncbi:unnamed protein product [Pseudo-nitzschia multistriata]|uniref:Uncharacterized protein n=1 Tax=Pseudo-nitzschia multistriata TaxID=183589 RepID=A0A448YUW6_9STRA|nr:unnamed protein product [Pseudo-nitzschia multistriata]
MYSLRKLLLSHRKTIILGTTTSTAIICLVSTQDSDESLRYHRESARGILDSIPCACDGGSSAKIPLRPVGSASDLSQIAANPPSLWNRALVSIGLSSPPLPRRLTPKDPAFQIPRKFLRKRQQDEEKMRKLVIEDAPKLRGDPNLEEKMASLRQEVFELAYGKGVTAQMREDFLIRYGCTGFSDEILSRLIELCGTRGIVEVGAGHGQWQKALTDAHSRESARKSAENQPESTGSGGSSDFCVAYDNNSNLPLNTHIYNQYTQPHHDHFGTVQKVESTMHLEKVLRSWACRGRALLMVYPPPGSMAIDALKTYTGASSDNDTLIYVGEGRGGANGDDAFFDFLENEEWILVDVLEVTRPPGDKGCEKLYILNKIRERFEE